MYVEITLEDGGLACQASNDLTWIQSCGPAGCRYDLKEFFFKSARGWDIMEHGLLCRWGLCQYFGGILVSHGVGKGTEGCRAGATAWKTCVEVASGSSIRPVQVVLGGHGNSQHPTSTTQIEHGRVSS